LSNPPTCSYSQEYYHQSGNDIIFRCSEKAREGGRCIFHLENNDKYRQEVFTELNKKIDHAISTNYDLLCIGYNISNITISKRFTIDVYFDYANLGNANFLKSEFNRYCSFMHAKFEDAQFTEVPFRTVLFIDATFTGSAEFHRCHFEDVSFRSANLADSNFFQAQFDRADFRGVNSTGECILLYTTFGESDFYLAHFSHVRFSGAKFTADADFTEASFSLAYFRQVKFLNPEKILFASIDLSKVSFLDTDITRVRFNSSVRWGGKDSSVIWDDTIIRQFDPSNVTENQAKETPLNGVLAIYRNLRENYEFQLRYEEA
jgi:uncharacterized protein YjbI with pentapeptide repeats